MARSTRPRSAAPKSNVVPLPEPRKRPRGMWGALLRAARLLPRRDRAGGQSRTEDRPNPFTPADPLPGVVGQGRRAEPPSIAMDAARLWEGAQDEGGIDPGWVGGYGGAYFASAYEEGQQWLGYAVLALLSQRPEYRVMTDTYATEMTREWVEFKSKSERETLNKARKRRTEKKTGAEDEDDHPEREMYRNEARIDELNTRLTELRTKQVFKAAIEHDGFQGSGPIYIDTGDEDDPDELRTPIGTGREDTQAKFGKDGLAHDFVPPSLERGDPDRTKLKKIKRLAAIEPMWCYPANYNASDPLRADWYRPETWWVMGKEVHRTRLLRIISNPVPDMLKPAYSFGGLSRTQMSKPYVDFYLRNRTSASDLLNNFSLWVLSTQLEVTSMEEGSDLLERVATANVLRDNQGMMVINQGTEEIDIKAAPLAGVKDLVGQSQEHMTTPSQIPIVKFFGNQPSGLNADSEGVIRLFYDRIRALQESLIREPLQTIVDLVMVELWGKADDDIEFEFVELWQLDEAGKSAIQKTKADQRAVDIEARIILPEEGRMAAARDPDSQYAGLDLHEPLPEPDPAELMMGPEGEGEQPQGPGGGMGGAKPQRRDLGSKTTQAANFGGAISGGLSSKDEILAAMDESSRYLRLALAADSEVDISLASRSLRLAMDALANSEDEDRRPFDPAEDAKWEEHLHPRSEAGKFAPKGSVAKGHHELLQAHGFVEHKDSPHAIYVHPGSNHQVAFSNKSMSKGTAYHSAVYKNNKFLHEVSNKKEHLAEALGKLDLTGKKTEPEPEKKVESLKDKVVVLPVGAKYPHSEHAKLWGGAVIRNWSGTAGQGELTESLVIGISESNLGKWQIWQKGKGVVASGEGQEGLNAAFEELHPYGMEAEAWANKQGEALQKKPEPSPYAAVHQKMTDMGYAPSASDPKMYKNALGGQIWTKDDGSWVSYSPGKPAIHGAGPEQLDKFLDMVKEGKQVYNVNFGKGQASGMPTSSPAPQPAAPTGPPPPDPAALRSKMADWDPPQKPAHAVSSYKGSGYHEMNALMRYFAVDEDDSESGKNVRAIRKWLDEASSQEDVVLYRGVKPGEYANRLKEMAKVGRSTHEHGFSSMATSQSFSSQWAGGSGGILYTIRVPKGSKVASVAGQGHDSEYEILAQQGSRFKITNVVGASGGPFKIEVELDQSHLGKEY